MLSLLLESLDALCGGREAAAAHPSVDAVHSHLFSELCHMAYSCPKHEAPCGALQALGSSLVDPVLDA
jgi:hypothetical protein